MYQYLTSHMYTYSYCTQVSYTNNFPGCFHDLLNDLGSAKPKKKYHVTPCPLSIQADQHQVCSSSGRTVYHSSSTTGSLLKTDLYSKCRDPKQFSSHTIHIIIISISNHPIEVPHGVINIFCLHLKIFLYRKFKSNNPYSFINTFDVKVTYQMSSIHFSNVLK